MKYNKFLYIISILIIVIISLFISSNTYINDTFYQGSYDVTINFNNTNDMSETLNSVGDYINDNDININRMNYNNGDVVFYTSTINQQDIIRLYFMKDMTVQPLNKLQSIGEDGVYNFIGSKSEVEEFQEFMGSNGYAEVKIGDQFVSNIGSVLKIASFVTVILLLVYILLISMSINKRSTEFSILSIEQASNKNIFKRFFSYIYIIPILFYALSMILIIDKINFFFIFIKIFTFLLLILMLPLLIYILFMIKFITKKRINYINNRRVSIVNFSKIAVLLAYMLSASIFINIFSQTQYMLTQYENLKGYENYSDFYSIKIRYNGQLSDDEMFDRDTKYKNLFNATNSDENFVMANFDDVFSSVDNPSNCDNIYAPMCRNAVVNENYLTYNPVMNGDEDVATEILYDGKTTNLLVPNHLKGELGQLTPLYIDALSYKLNRDITSEDINIIYYDDNQEFFTFSTDGSPSVVSDIILEVDTGMAKDDVYYSYFTGNVFYSYNGDNFYNAATSYFEDNNLSGSVNSVYNVMSEVTNNINMIKHSIMINVVVLFILLVILMYYLVALCESIFYDTKIELALLTIESKVTLRYLLTKQLDFFIAVVLSTILIIFISQSILFGLCVFGLVILCITLTLLYYKKQLRENYLAILKGEL